MSCRGGGHERGGHGGGALTPPFKNIPPPHPLASTLRKAIKSSSQWPKA
uniref:Uncharacterized protein n=1 Tax=Arundo donax TaxID=35708 RepID=A0A0A8YC73_ARUDO